MRLTTYAEVFSPDRDSARPGFRGNLLAEVLDESEGRWEVELRFADRFAKDMRELATLTHDRELAAVAERGSVMVSLEHLRDLDPSTTRIIYGATLSREPGDGPLPGFDR